LLVACHKLTIWKAIDGEKIGNILLKLRIYFMMKILILRTSLIKDYKINNYKTVCYKYYKKNIFFWVTFYGYVY